MSDWQKSSSDFSKGLADSPESRMPWNQLNQDMQMGRRAAGHDESGPTPPAAKGGDIWSGLVGLLGLAGFIVGLLAGASFLDKGWIGVLIMIGSAALGLAVAVVPLVLLQKGVSAIYEKYIWRRQSKDNTAESLVQLWEAKFGAPPSPEFIGTVGDNGAAWIMDTKGNFILRMNNGGKLFVGHEEESNGEMSLNVRKEGGGGFDEHDASNIMLVNKSLGHQSVHLYLGNEKTKRLMWAAAKLADIDVEGYQPDRRALQLLQDMRSALGPRAGA